MSISGGSGVNSSGGAPVVVGSSFPGLANLLTGTKAAIKAGPAPAPAHQPPQSVNAATSPNAQLINDLKALQAAGFKMPTTAPVSGSSSGGGGGGNALAAYASATGGSVPSSAPSLASISGGSAGGTSQADSNSIMQQAIDAVNAYLNPQLDDLTNQGTEASSAEAQQVADDKNTLATQTKNVANVYALLGQQLGDLGQKSDTGFANTQQNVGDAYTKLQNSIGSNYDAADAKLAATGLPSTSGQDLLGQGRANYGSLADVLGTNTNNILAGERQGFNSIFQTEQGQAASTGAFQQAQLNAMSNKQLATLQNNLDAELTKLSDQRGVLENNKSSQISTLYQKLLAASQAAAATAAYRQAQLDQNQQKIGISQQLANQTGSYQQGELSISQQNANTTAATLAEKQIVDQANLAKLQSQTQLNQTKAQQLLASGGTASKDAKNGFNAATNYISSQVPSSLAQQYASVFSGSQSKVLFDSAQGAAGVADLSKQLVNMSNTLAPNTPGGYDQAYQFLNTMLNAYMGKGTGLGGAANG